MTEPGSHFLRSKASFPYTGRPDGRDEHDPIVVVQPGRPDVRPLFAIAGAGASVSTFFELSGALPPTLPLVGLQARGLDGRMPPFASVEQAANAYVAAIIDRQRVGPYRVLGHSFGGWIAFEVACQLEARGEQVDELFIVDAAAPDSDQAPPRRADRVAAFVQLVKLYNLLPAAGIGLAATDFANLDDKSQLALLHRELVKVRVLRPNTPVNLLEGVVCVLEQNLRSNYRTSLRRTGSTNIANAADSDVDIEARVEQWRPYAEALESAILPGNHITMLVEPNARWLGDWLRPRLHGA